MALYCYLKAEPCFLAKNKRRVPVQRLIMLTSPFLIITGLCLLLATAYPFINYKALLFSKDQKKIIIPIPEITLAEAQGFIHPLTSLGKKQNPSGKIVRANDFNSDNKQKIDLDQVDSWFPTATLPTHKKSKITHYAFSIPELRIDKAVVEIGGKEVKNSLVHYPGTALPGEYGNTVIFGHSVLPIFYNPKDYRTIFSTIPTLEKGSKIYIDFDGINFTYEVEDYFEVEPGQVEVLEQRFNEQVLSLITCVPPGTYRKRGVIKARLVKI